jgi:hypothetical protein
VKRGRQFPLLVAACVIITLIACLILSRDREPIYKGKKLSEWAELYELSFNPVGVGEQPTPEEYSDRRKAVEAAHHTRDEILPRAVKLIQYEKPAWKGKVMHAMERIDVRRWCPLFIWGPFYGDQGEDSLVYFDMLGPDARTAVPELTLIMKHADSARVRERAMYALARTGKEGLRPLIETLADPKNRDRRAAAYAIGDMKDQGTVASLAVPILVKCLEDADPNMSSAAATVLGELGLEASIAVPGLTNCLQSSDPYVREEAISALGNFGEKARAALPSLLVVASIDADYSVRESATNALSEIAPDSLRKSSP